MPWRLIGFLLVLVLVAAFATVNIPNRSDVSFGFYTFEEVPIFLSLLIAFILGTLLMVPFLLRRSKKNAAQAIHEDTQGEPDSGDDGPPSG